MLFWLLLQATTSPPHTHTFSLRPFDRCRSFFAAADQRPEVKTFTRSAASSLFLYLWHTHTHSLSISFSFWHKNIHTHSLSSFWKVMTENLRGLTKLGLVQSCRSGGHQKHLNQEIQEIHKYLSIFVFSDWNKLNVLQNFYLSNLCSI